MMQNREGEDNGTGFNTAAAFLGRCRLATGLYCWLARGADAWKYIWAVVHARDGSACGRADAAWAGFRTGSFAASTGGWGYGTTCAARRSGCRWYGAPSAGCAGSRCGWLSDRPDD